jgi:hypothetical protein
MAVCDMISSGLGLKSHYAIPGDAVVATSVLALFSRRTHRQHADRQQATTTTRRRKMENRSLATAVFAALENKSAPVSINQSMDESVLLTALSRSTTRCDQIMQRRVSLAMPGQTVAP